MGMVQEDKWTRFAETGRIQDYLDYRKMKNVMDTEEKFSYYSGQKEQEDSSRKEKTGGMIR